MTAARPILKTAGDKVAAVFGETSQTAVEARVPPQDLAAEAAVLSACMIDRDKLDGLLETLRPEDFYSEAHRRIFEACVELAQVGTTPDIVTVATWLRDHNRMQQVGGMSYLTTVLNAAPALANVGHYVEIVRRKARGRAVVLLGQRITAQGYSGVDADALVANAARELEELRTERAVVEPGGDVLHGPELAEELPPVEWLCEGLKLTSGAPTNAAGNAYSGKSLAWADVALAVATGGNAWGAYPCRRDRAVFVDYDGQGRRVSQARLQRLARARGVDLAALGDRITYLRRPGFYLDDQGVTERLLRLLDGHGLAVIDSWRGATPNTDEWRRGPVQLVGDLLETVSSKTGCTIVVIDHNIKPPRDGKSSRSSMHDVHGSTAKAELAQSHFAFEGQEGEQLTHVVHTKERVSGQTLPPFALRFEDVERDGDPRWGLRVVRVDRDQQQPDAGSTRFQHVLEAVRDGLRKHPGAAGKDALARLIGASAPDVRAAVDHLVLTTHEVIPVKAPRNGVRLYLAGMVPGERE